MMFHLGLCLFLFPSQLVLQRLYTPIHQKLWIKLHQHVVPFDTIIHVNIVNACYHKPPVLQKPCEARCLGTPNPIQNHLHKWSEHKGNFFQTRKTHSLRILTPPMETPDPPFMTPRKGPQNMWVWHPQDIPRILRVLFLCSMPMFEKRQGLRGGALSLLFSCLSAMSSLPTPRLKKYP